MALEKEKAYLEKILPDLVGVSLNHFAVVSENSLIGVYPTIEIAFSEAVKRVGLKDVLVRKVGEQEQEVCIPALTLGLLSANNPHPIVG
jgi:hypothetical protein